MNLIRSQYGFTTVEIIIVVMVVAILAGIAGINILSRMPSYRLKGAARQIASDLMKARMSAVSQDNEFKIFFDNDHQYRILDDDDGDGTADAGEEIQSKDIQDEYPGVTFSSTNNPIFQPNGTATNLATITLTNSSGSKTVTISIAGRIKIS